MMLTREEAGATWCPMVRSAREQALARDGQVERGNCLADQCAMWRWGTKTDPNHVQATTPPASFRPAPRIQSEYGYCGLAGAPSIGGAA